MSDFPAEMPSVGPASEREIRPMVWSIRRELWENRSIFIAPLIAAGVVQFGSFISAVTLPHRLRAVMAMDPVKRHQTLSMPYSFAAGMLIITAFIVGFFYCLDALHGERL